MRRRRRGKKTGGSRGEGAGSAKKGGISNSHRRGSKRGSGGKSKSSSGGRGGRGRSSQAEKPIANAPVLPLRQIESSSPVGTGLNPLAEPFHDNPKKAVLSPPRFYKVMFFDSFISAYDGASDIKAACSGCDQVNVVVKAEGNMADEKILGIDPKVKLFAGEAWHLIHTRRSEEGWYEASQ